MVSYFLKQHNIHTLSQSLSLEFQILLYIVVYLDYFQFDQELDICAKLSSRHKID